MMDRLRDLLLSHTKAHHLTLLGTLACFVRVCWVKPEAGVVAAAGTTLAAMYAANSWAGKPQPDKPQ